MKGTCYFYTIIVEHACIGHLCFMFRINHIIYQTTIMHDLRLIKNFFHSKFYAVFLDLLTHDSKLTGSELIVIDMSF